MDHDLEQFLTQLIIDLEDVCSDLEFDYGANTVAEQKLHGIIRQIEDKQDAL